MSNFWIRWAVAEAVSVVDAFIAGSKLSPAAKEAGLELIAAAQKFLGVL